MIGQHEQSAVEATGMFLRTKLQETEGYEEMTLSDQVALACELVGKESYGFMVTSRECAFLAAVGSVAVLTDDPGREKIQAEIQVMKTIAAAGNGIPVDFTQMVVPDDPIGLQGIFDEKYTGPWKRR